MIPVHENCFSAKAQRGAALVVSLVILVLLTIIGVSALNMSKLETLIVRNEQQRQISMQYAEAVLKQGQAVASSMTSPPYVLDDGTVKLGSGASVTWIYYAAGSSSYKNAFTDINWSSGAAGVDVDGDTIIDGGYFVEFLGERAAAGSDTESKTLYYRVVARSTAGGTETVIETTFGVEKT